MKCPASLERRRGNREIQLEGQGMTKVKKGMKRGTS
jgi:hypothetical protein